MSDLRAAREQRSDLIDALRGFALFGVLLVNLRSLSLYEFLPAAERALLPSAGIDRVLDVALTALVDLKFITLFTLLFGVGFAMQMQRSDAGAGLNRHYARRMLILLAIGMLHAYLLWWGDILRFYALAGLLLIPLARLSPMVLAACGVAVLLLPAMIQPWVRGMLPVMQPSAEAAAAALQAFSSDDFGTVMRGNLDRDLRMRVAVWMLPCFVIGRVLIGVALGRSGVLFEPARHLPFWRRCLCFSLLVATPLTALFLLRDQGALSALPWPQSEVGKMLMRMLRELAPVALGLGYVAAFVLLFQHPLWRRWLLVLAPLGRTALTQYVSQTLLGIALFYGVGMGIGPRYGELGIVVVGVLIFALQVLISHIWMARFRFGPLEWLWRSLTYARMQPMRRGKSASAPVA